MRIKSNDPKPECDGRVVKMVKQKETEFELVFTDTSSIKVKLVEETSSVMVRDVKDNFEYAD